jgi:hypothetical protein
VKSTLVVYLVLVLAIVACAVGGGSKVASGHEANEGVARFVLGVENLPPSVRVLECSGAPLNEPDRDVNFHEACAMTIDPAEFAGLFRGAAGPGFPHVQRTNCVHGLTVGPEIDLTAFYLGAAGSSEIYVDATRSRLIAYRESIVEIMPSKH